MSDFRTSEKYQKVLSGLTDEEIAIVENSGN